MRLMSGTVVALALAAGAASLSGQSAPVAPLRLVSTPWPPFTNEAGKPRIALNLVETALGRAGLNAGTTIVEPAQFNDALMSDRYDGSAAAWKDAGRERVLVFSEPYLENRLVLVGRAGE